MISQINWDAITAETIKNLSTLLQINTVNPPGNEMEAIQVVRDILLQEGISEDNFKILESTPSRGNIVARLKGDGTARPMMLSGHVDVVPVEREFWTHDPFKGEIVNDCVWGRGAIDMKGTVAMYLQIFLLAHRYKLPLKRDLIFAAIADEEVSFNHGSRFLVSNHRDLIDAEFAITEEGARTLYIGGMRLYPLMVAEKGVCWLNATSKGRPGHGSIPHADNAIFHLVRALERLRQARYLPFHPPPVSRLMFSSLSKQSRFPYNLIFRMMQNPYTAHLALRFLPEDEGDLFATMVTNTFSPTVLKAGTETNVIPSTAQVRIDCRLLPGYKPEDAMQEILAVTGPEISLETIDTSLGTNFSPQTTLFNIMEKAVREMDPEGIPFPFLSTGASDAVEYAKAGITVYGFTPGIVPEGFPLRELVHAHNERLPILSIRSGLPAIWNVVQEFCCV